MRGTTQTPCAYCPHTTSILMSVASCMDAHTHTHTHTHTHAYTHTCTKKNNINYAADQASPSNE